MKTRWKLAIGLAAVAGMTGVIWEATVRSAWIPAALAQSPPASPFLTDIRGRVFSRQATDEARDARPISLSEMGPWIPMVTVAIEDRRFREHCGIDFYALAAAVWRNAKSLRVVSGASTITQQLVKVATGRPPRTLAVKAREAVAATKLERARSKDQILEEYLNRIDYGNRRIGVEAAAVAYFGKPCRDLTIGEAIYLAGLPQSPRRFNPWRNPSAALQTYRRNVTRLAELALLPPGVSEESLLDFPPIVSRHEPERMADAFARIALSRSPAGPRIATTLDLDVQTVAEALLEQHLRSAESLGVGDAAIVIVENATGEVRALACAGRTENEEINSAIVPRSCGSTLKPFVYLQGIEERKFTAATLLPDTADAIPATYSDYDPQNYNRRAYGPVRVREALGNSLNVPAVVALSKVGARRAFDSLARWGFRIPGGFDESGAGFVLGNAEIRLIDLAGAYGGLARGGLAWPARVLPSEPIASDRLASPGATEIVTDILCDNEARRLSFGTASPLDLGVRIAVKTGTSSGFRDRWCVGFSATHTVAVWAGNLNGRSLGEVLAVRAAAPLWAAMMRHLLANGSIPLPLPQGDHQVIDIASESGLLPRAGERTVREIFLRGTAPTIPAAEMYANGQLLLPPEYTNWCLSAENRINATTARGELKILFPTDGSTYIFDKNLPASQQSITLRSSHECVWSVNGKPVDLPTISVRPGTWTVEAHSGNSRAMATFQVETEN